MSNGNHIKALQRVAGEDGVLLPAQIALRFRGSLRLVDVPETAAGSTLKGSAGGEGQITGYTEILLDGLDPDGAGGFVLGSANGGWISVKSDGNGFRVYNDDETGFLLTADNSTATVTIAGELALSAGLGVMSIGDTSAAGNPSSGIRIQSVSGAIKFRQHAAPTVTGSRASNAALADLLTKLAAAGLIIDGTS